MSHSRVEILTLSCANVANSSQPQKQRAAPTIILCTHALHAFLYPLQQKGEACTLNMDFLPPNYYRQPFQSSFQRELSEQKSCRDEKKGLASLSFC